MVARLNCDVVSLYSKMLSNLIISCPAFRLVERFVLSWVFGSHPLARIYASERVPTISFSSFFLFEAINSWI